MKAEGKVQVVVRSRKVPIDTISYTRPVYSMSGVLIGSQPHRLVLYGTRLDDEHSRAIEEAKKLASSLGMGLEVIDESRSGFFSRFLARLGGNGRSPAVRVPSPPAMVNSDQATTFARGC